MMKEFSFTFTEIESNTILNALAELPFNKSSLLIKKIQDQAATQLEKEDVPDSGKKK